jgi:hypothetical protein
MKVLQKPPQTGQELSLARYDLVKLTIAIGALQQELDVNRLRSFDFKVLLGLYRSGSSQLPVNFSCATHRL